MSTTTMTTDVTMTATVMQRKLHTVRVRLGCEVVEGTLKPTASLPYPGRNSKLWRSPQDRQPGSACHARLHGRGIPAGLRGRKFVVPQVSFTNASLGLSPNRIGN